MSVAKPDTSARLYSRLSGTAWENTANQRFLSKIDNGLDPKIEEEFFLLADNLEKIDPELLTSQHGLPFLISTLDGSPSAEQLVTINSELNSINPEIAKSLFTALTQQLYSYRVNQAPHLTRTLLKTVGVNALGSANKITQEVIDDIVTNLDKIITSLGVKAVEGLDFLTIGREDYIGALEAIAGISSRLSVMKDEPDIVQKFQACVLNSRFETRFPNRF